MGKVIEMFGKKFSRLTVTGRAEIKGDQAHWNCVCDCGKELVVEGAKLRRGHTRSCGCLLVDIKTTHGMTNSKEYKIWASMVQRCTNPNDASYSSYGGRGIKVCKRWEKFENFYADMGTKPKSMSIDRIDNNGNYEPGNCKWATRSEQNRNKRSNVILSFNGKNMCLSDWSKETRIPEKTLWARIKKYKWSAERALTEGSDYA